MGIDPRSDRAVYRQLADILRGDIHSGKYAAGETLPSETRIAQEHGIGREAVRQAIAVLRAEGLVTTIRGEGTRVREPLARQRVSLRKGDRAVARMPTEQERRELDLEEGVPVVEIHRTNGQRDTLPGDRTEILAT